MRYFDFSRLIRKYSTDIKAITIAEGYYDEMGDWVRAFDKETTLRGAVISFKESKIYRSEGTLTAQDRRLYTLEPIDSALYGAQVVHKGKVYSLEESTENAEFTGVHAYTLRYVSAFKETRPAFDITEMTDALTDAVDGVLTKPMPPVEDPNDDLTDENEDLEKRLDGVT